MDHEIGKEETEDRLMYMLPIFSPHITWPGAVEQDV